MDTVNMMKCQHSKHAFHFSILNHMVLRGKHQANSNPKICISIGSFFIGPLAGDTLQLDFPGVLQANVSGAPCIAKL